MTKRVLIGNLGDGNYGLRIAKAGFDVTALPADPTKLIFDSQWPQLMPLYMVGSMGVAQNASASVSFTQLPFIPMFSALVKGSSGSSIPTTYTLNPQVETEYSQVGSQAALSYLQIWVNNNSINIYNNASKDQGWPGYITVVFAIYKTSAGG